MLVTGDASGNFWIFPSPLINNGPEIFISARFGFLRILLFYTAEDKIYKKCLLMNNLMSGGFKLMFKPLWGFIALTCRCRPYH